MAHDQPTSYRELADVLNALPLLLREARRARGLSQRATADQLGMSFSTVCRIEDGRDGMVSHALAVLAWLDQTPTSEETNHG
jgi:transcriptional regulator with XRE-family HTH domain